ncbi:MAG: bifunctional riboflavin kinase/FAD synthetase [Candidatus Rokubacteria bacterium]|nr:bifunctional riboflavin kinase/FAD synthetase [Candidatus Rokubacteria bacterium]
MRISHGLDAFPSDAAPCVAALGTFDGVHLGHRAILGTAVSRARALGVPAVACTFDPNPMEVLRPERAPLPITTLAERLALIAGTGIDATAILSFTPEVAAVEPEAFVKDVLLGRLRVREVVVGFNHTFGRGARGNARLLESLSERLGFQVHVMPPLAVDGMPVSSSEIRATLWRGEVDRAARFLGRLYSLGGPVVRGAGRGRSLGFPTANLRPERPPLVPTGVYACQAKLGDATHRAVVNIGVRPTFDERELAVEAHLIDFTEELYGRRLEVGFVRRLRDEMKFPGVAALCDQIARDVAAARRAL